MKEGAPAYFQNKVEEEPGVQEFEGYNEDAQRIKIESIELENQERPISE